MTSKAKSLRMAAQVLTLAVVGWALRKASQVPASRVQNLRNRLLLTREFFRATDVSGTIHQAEFDFIYLDGDRSPHTKRVSGLWQFDSDQPDSLRAVPVWSARDWDRYGSLERRAMILGRADRRGNRGKRSPESVIDVLRQERFYLAEGGVWAPSAAEKKTANDAYLSAFFAYPSWPLPAEQADRSSTPS